MYVCELLSSQTMALDIDGLLEDLKAAPANSTFVLHTVAHNPSGVDPTPDQWKLIAEVVQEKNAIPVFDTAYQVFFPTLQVIIFSQLS
jgi:aspartate/tyrosine/aromatic aminotransferase